MNDMRFKGRFWFISNFYDHGIEITNLWVLMLDHAFQLSKTANPDH